MQPHGPPNHLRDSQPMLLGGDRLSRQAELPKAHRPSALGLSRSANATGRLRLPQHLVPSVSARRASFVPLRQAPTPKPQPLHSG